MIAALVIIALLLALALYYAHRTNGNDTMAQYRRHERAKERWAQMMSDMMKDKKPQPKEGES